MTRTDTLDLDSALGPQQQVDLPAGPVRYRERGAGPAILFVHGFLVNGALWRNVVPELAPDFRCIAPDWPLGSHELPLGSPDAFTPYGIAQLVADFMAALELEDVTLVGNDSGGALCQIVATRHPERLGRLVLTPCDAFENFPPKMFKYLGPVAKTPGALTLMTQSMRLRMNRRMPFAFGWLTIKPLPDDVSDHYVNPVINDRRIREEARAWVLGTDPQYTLEAAEKLRDFDRPALLAWAPEDRFFPIAHAERLAELIPDARVERIPDARSFVAEDQPHRLAEAIAQFVRKPTREPDPQEAQQ
jgi:pimeloyl-ACP methyl ester carboxylesterase